MLKRIILLSYLISSSLCLLQSQEIKEEIRPVHIGLIYPISTNGIDAPHIQNRFSLHAIGGVSGGELGFCMSGFGHVTRGNVQGIQMSGFGNVVTGRVEGILLAGFGNAASDFQGFQGAGFGNAAKIIQGIQAAGFGNVSSRSEGIQAAGFGNVSGSSKGIQAAGFGNVSGNKEGVQAAGFMNIAGDVQGIQAAGFMNVAKNVKGIQVAGFMNIAESSEYPIGIINIIKNGEMHLQASIDELGNTLLDFRSGSRNTYGFIGFGINTLRTNESVAVSHLGFGINLRLSETFSFRPELQATNIVRDDNYDFRFAQSIRILADIRLGKIHLYAGPGLSLIRSKNDVLENTLLLSSWTRGSESLFLIGSWQAGVSFRILG